MHQQSVKFQCLSDKKERYTPWGGALLIEEIFSKFGIDGAINEHIGARKASLGKTYTRQYLRKEHSLDAGSWWKHGG